DEAEFSELSYARLVADRFATDHHEFIVRPKAIDILPTLVRHYGEPYADSSAIPSYYVAKLTRGHVTVALNGDGRDECFAGYERYLGVQVAVRYEAVPGLLRRLAIDCLDLFVAASAPRRRRLRQIRSVLQAAGLPAAVRYFQWMNQVRPPFRSALYT